MRDPRSRKGLKQERWTALEDEALRELSKAGLTDSQIGKDPRINKPARKVGYRRRLIFKDTVDQAKRQLKLNAVSLTAAEKAMLLAELQRFGETRPLWWYQWRYSISEHTLGNLIRDENIIRDEARSKRQHWYYVWYGRRQSQALKDSASQHRAALRVELVRQAADSQYGALPKRQCACCKQDWPETDLFFPDYEDPRKGRRFFKRHCRACPPQRKAPGPYSNFNPLELLPVWQPFYYGLNCAVPRLFDMQGPEVQVVPLKKIVEMVSTPGRFTLRVLAELVLDSARRHGILAKVDQLDSIYFPGERVFNHVVDELSIIGAPRSGPPDVFSVIDLGGARRLHAFLSMPFAVAKYLG